MALAGVPPLCCVSPAAPPGSVSVENGRLRIDLSRARDLSKRGGSCAVVAAGKNLLVARAARGEYVAIDRACTHGGAMCTFNAKRQTLQCTSLNHAEYDLRGTLLHGRTHGNLRTYPVRVSGNIVEIDIGATA